MNIKRAKQEIKNCIEAYLLKNERGEYVLPAVRQRPLFLIGPPGIGKTQIMEQVPGSARWGLCPTPSPTTPGRAPSVFRLLKKAVRRQRVCGDRVHHERDCSLDLQPDRGDRA